MSRRDGRRAFDFRRSGYEDTPTRSLMSSKSMQLLEIARGKRMDDEARYPINPGPIRNRSGYRDDPYPYQRNHDFSANNFNYFPEEEPTPLISNNKPNNKPPPLIPPEALEQLRAGLRATSSRYESENFRPSRLMDEPSFDMDAYTREEEETRRTIEEIISVAQALREKMDREEELRREELRREELRREEMRRQELAPIVPPIIPRPAVRAEPEKRPKRIEEIPSLLDLKPKIPSLLDIYVPPPDVDNVVQENILIATRNTDFADPEMCWNCEEPGHRYVDCDFPKMRNFCFRCGRPGFDVSSCPYCMIYD